MVRFGWLLLTGTQPTDHHMWRGSRSSNRSAYCRPRLRRHGREPGGVAATAVSHTHTDTHTRERVCGSQASGRKKHNSRWPGRHQDGPLWSVSLSLSNFVTFLVFFFRIQTGHPTISIIVLFCYRAKSSTSLRELFSNLFFKNKSKVNQNLRPKKNTFKK